MVIPMIKDYLSGVSFMWIHKILGENFILMLLFRKK